MHRLLAFSLLMFLQCAVLPAPHVAASDRGTRSGWERFIFTGNVTFSDKQLMDALLGDIEFLLATHPQADIAAMPGVVERRLVAGYHRAGFPDVAIRAVLDKATRGATITLDEGKRFHCGQVRVEDAVQIDTQRLIQRLSQPFPGKDAILSYLSVNGVWQPHWIDASGNTKDFEKPVWKQGDPAPFGTEDQLNVKLTSSLRDIGFSMSKVKLHLVKNDENATVDLVVSIIEEGKPDVIDKVAVEGIVNHSAEQILRRIGPIRGKRANHQLINKVTERLWSSGRFSEINVKAEKQLAEGVTLRITLREAAKVPLLGEPISDEAETFLKAGRWLQGMTSRGDDLVAQVHVAPWHVTYIQSKQGQIVHWTDTSEKTADGKPKFGAFLLDGSQCLFCYSPTGTKYHGRFPLEDVKVTIQTTIGAAEEEDKLWVVRLGFGASNNRAKDDPTIRFALTLNPSQFLPLAYKSQLVHTWDDHTLISTLCRNDGIDEVIRIDKETGKFEVRSAVGQLLAFENGRFDRERREIEDCAKSLRNTYDARRPISTFVASVCDPDIAEAITAELGTGEVPLRHLAGAIQKLVAADILGPVDHLLSSDEDLVDEQEMQDKVFSIPCKPSSGRSLRDMILHGIAQCTVGLASGIFTEGSWPLRVAREAGFVVMGQSQHTNEVLEEIYTDAKYGPICHATISQLLASVDPELSARFANRGIDRLNAESFGRDYRDVVDGSFGQWLSHVIEALRLLNPEELESLVRLINDDRVANVLRRIHSATNNDADEGVLCFEGVKDELEDWLRSMAK